VSITPPLNEQTVNIKQFLDNKHLVHDIFCDVVIYNRPHVRKNRNGMNDKLAIEEVLLYFAKDANSFLTNNFVCNSLVIIAAFDFAHNRKIRTQKSRISEKQFQSFLEAMFLFSHLWELYLVSDDNVQDEILFHGEFVRSREKVSKMKGFEFKEEVSEEEWASHFHLMDSNQNDEVTFNEVAKYVTKHVVTPKKYASFAISLSKHIKHSNSDRKNMRVFTTKRENTKKVINLVSQLSFKVDGRMFAVDLSPFEGGSFRSWTRDRFSTSYNLKSLRNVLNQLEDDAAREEQVTPDGGSGGAGTGSGGEQEASSLANDENVASRMSLFRLIREQKAALKQQENGLNPGDEEQSEGETELDDLTDNGNSETKKSPKPRPSKKIKCEVRSKATSSSKLSTDLLKTRQRLAMSKARFEASLVPDHAAKTETQLRAAQMREIHCVPTKESMEKTARRFMGKQEKTFAMKFLEESKHTACQLQRPRPVAQPTDDDGDESFLFVTENRHNFDNSSQGASDTDSNYMAVDTRFADKIDQIYGDGPSCEMLPQNSLSIKVQSDFGGSIHTSSMQHLSFDRDVSRKPPHIDAEASIELSVNDYDVPDDVSLSNKYRDEGTRAGSKTSSSLLKSDGNMTYSKRTTSTDEKEGEPPKFEPLNHYARRSSGPDAGKRVEYSGSVVSTGPHTTISRVESAPSRRRDQGEFNDSSFIQTGAGHHFYATDKTRPGSAPARPVNLALTVGSPDDLEKKYYPPSKKLGYYVQRAKSPDKSRVKSSTDRPRSTYRAPSRPDNVARSSSPLYHAWMETGLQRTRKINANQRPVPMSMKKTQAIKRLRRHGLNITGPRA